MPHVIVAGPWEGVLWWGGGGGVRGGGVKMAKNKKESLTKTP